MNQPASTMLKETAAQCRAFVGSSERQKALLDRAACDLESAATIIHHNVEAKPAPLEWKRYNHNDPATWPKEKGTYRVMVSGDSESCDGHTIYDYPDYSTWAEFCDGEDDDGNERLEFGQGSHDEEADSFFAYYGPVAPVPPLNLKD